MAKKKHNNRCKNKKKTNPALNSPAADVNAPCPAPEDGAPAADAAVPAPGTVSAAEDGEAPAKKSEAPAKDAEAPEEDAEAPEEDAEAPEEDAEAPEEDAEAPEEDAKAPAKDSEDAEDAAENGEDTHEKEADSDGDEAQAASDSQTAARIRVRRKKLDQFAKASLGIASAVMLGMTALSFTLPLRQTVSDAEKRKLAEFPSFSAGALFSGRYFSEIGVWFSDTVPFRDSLTKAAGTLRRFLFTSGAQTGFQEGVQGDEIPDVPAPAQTADSAKAPEQTAAAPEQTAATQAEPASAGDQTTVPAPTGGSGETASASDAAAQETTAAPSDATAASAPAASSAPAAGFEELSSLIISGNAGYEYYHFVQSTADAYTAAVNRAAQLLAGKAQVYAMIIPTSIDVTLDPAVRRQISVSDQKKAIAYMESCFSPEVKRVSIFDTLTAHRDEYIYFRTDHHWTGLGAYYAYREFCRVKGVKPVEIKDAVTHKYEGFLGSFYSDSGRNPALGETPDYVWTVEPKAKTSLQITQSDGSVINGDVIYNADNSIAPYKYSAFIWGDNPFSVMVNEDMESGDSCLVVKESFGNAFVPMLAAHYKTVYVMDYRYYNGSVAALQAQYGIRDVIFANNISMTRAQSLVGQLASKIG